MAEIDSRKLAYSIKEAVSALGISRSHLYALIKRGEIVPGRLAGKVVIPTNEMRRFFEANFKPR